MLLPPATQRRLLRAPERPPTPSLTALLVLSLRMLLRRDAPGGHGACSFSLYVACQSGLTPRVSAACRPDPTTFAFPPKERPVRMFDGHSFEGWSGKIGRYWTVENGAIKAIMSPYDAPPVSTYLFSDTKHRNFRLLFEMRMPKGNHSGIGFWGQRHSFEGEDYTWRGHLAILPQTGIFDIYNRGWEARCKREGTTAGISGDWLNKGPGTGGDLMVDGSSAADVYSLHGWNQVEILAVGSRIRIAINGVMTSDWTDPEPHHIREGPIALQQHWMNVGEEQIVLFRGLVISDNPEDYLITTK